MERDDAGASKSIQKAIDVLEYVAASASDVSVKDVAAALRLPKSTAHRLLANLTARGLVEQDPATERYRPGLRLFTLGSRALDRSADRGGLRSLSHRYLNDLAEQVGDTVYLGVLDGAEVLYIDSIEGNRAMRAAAPSGTRRALYCTAVGKVLLSGTDPAVVDQLLAVTPMLPRTPKTPVTVEAFHERVAGVRRDGYALDIGEYEEGLACIASPIYDSRAAIVAAVGLTGPSWRLADERLEHVIEALRRAARAISAEMGYRPNAASEIQATLERVKTRPA
jgi:DNA-binding IclR family transcriptional regulator